jgi:Holliday junction resolvasome RuvABC DNA-binding subunit
MICQNCSSNNDVTEFRKGTDLLVFCVECRFKLLDPKFQDPENKWSNSACLGYTILGAARLGYSQKQIKELVRAVNSEFDQSSIVEATVVYELSPY